MLRYMLDTNIVSYYLRRASPALEERVNAALRERTIAISAITRAELRYGQMGLPPQAPAILSAPRARPQATAWTLTHQSFWRAACGL